MYRVLFRPVFHLLLHLKVTCQLLTAKSNQPAYRVTSDPAVIGCRLNSNVANETRHVRHGVLERPHGAELNRAERRRQDRRHGEKSVCKERNHPCLNTRQCCFEWTCVSCNIKWTESKRTHREEKMENTNGFSSDRNVLCLFDVDGTLTPPREVSPLSRYTSSNVLIAWCMQ